MNKKDALIIKLYNGKCTPQDLELLLDLIQQASDPKDEKVLKMLWDELNVSRNKETLIDTRILDNTLAKIEKQKQQPIQKEIPSFKKKQFTRRLFFKTAAAAAVLLLIALPSYFYWNNSAQNIQIQTAFAEQKTIELPDQSKVILNANSSISYNKNWTDQAVRKVWLKGEAYFQVSKNETKQQKFQVITKDLTVEVLGTVFNVNTRDLATKVFLEEGKVNLKIKEQQEDLLMKPGELVTYSSLTKLPEKKMVMQQRPASWKNGTMTYPDNPLEEILEKIREIYGIEIKVEQKQQLDRKFRLGIPVDDLELTYEVLKEATKLEIIKEEQRWVIK
jgi:ferric-dicitrate binding protein FerR (iron transport regulator)